MNEYETITVERHGPIGVITLNRPKVLNALSSQLFAEFYAAFEELDADEDASVIVVTGAGDRAFSAGADIKEMARLAAEGKRTPGGGYPERGWRLATSTKPTIGALNGLCYGGGAVMASSFDIRVGCERTRFRFLAVTYGRINSTWTLPAIIGMPMAKEILYTGRVVEADEAYRIGLLNRLVAADEVLSTALEIGNAIAGNDQRMVRGAKKLLHDGIGAGWREMFDSERLAQAGPLTPTPIEEGFKEFIERKGTS